ncbi:uncharacterized protein BDR25DRAFT_276182 [Lindgomyces ingoldianus]|uniref:Uncharacterized protein n=1 Tax=Lindgomyces ingoldianus TaxID=673940 RepID=A0ACB6RGE8_9PLEO|nr:uncharacterized protein BDR25DRAFT_276182 [Lindgomyces ingoldianus]KAF2478291.1 hypothetical protein BDR25DRAFT_276182 [Lindgomyces ingoldianus]
MATDFAMDSPFAAALQQVVQPKLAECGWTTGDANDSTLFEYILAMLSNGKNESQIASELANDLLDLGPDNTETPQFAHWLFEQLELLRQQLNGASGGGAEASQPNDNRADSASNNVSLSAQDTEMEGAGEPNIPTGPKAMRNGSGNTSGSGSKGPKRMLNQLNRQMDRTASASDDSPLHRVRGSAGSGRINSHSSRDPPKGPRSQQVGRGLAAMANGRMGSTGGMGMGGMNGMNAMPMNNMGGMPPMPMPPAQNGMPGLLDPQQQMALMQMYEQQARMMQQIFSGQTPSPFVNPNFQHGNQRGNRSGQGKPLSERIDKPFQPGNKQRLPPSTKFSKKEGQDETMTDTAPGAENAEGASAMEVDNARFDPSRTMCKFNLRCSKLDCPFVHQSPAANEGQPVDMDDTCSFGAACMNRKCAGKHPSPAQRTQHKAETDCVFYPNCRDMANCPYRHPTMPPCRNGADCTTPGCKFFHSQVMCKFNPCTNNYCTFKHTEGQKKIVKDKVWVAPKNGEEGKEHVSERKFVADDAEEELILPGKMVEDTPITT